MRTLPDEFLDQRLDLLALGAERHFSGQFNHSDVRFDLSLRNLQQHNFAPASISRLVLLHKGKDRGRCVTFQTIVYEEKEGLFVLASPSDECSHGIAGLWIGILHFTVR